MEDYRPGDLPYPEQDERKKFCNYHYKGVLVILIPILCIPILFGREYIEYRMAYIATCVFLYYILNIMAQGAVAFIYIVFLPLVGISDSKQLSKFHYSNLMFITYGCIFLAVMMDLSLLSERLAMFVIRICGANLRKLQIFLMLTTCFFAIFIESTFVCAIFMKIAQAVIKEYNNAGILELYTDEETYERESPLYPTRPAIGIYLTVCYATNLGSMISIIQNPNCIIYEMYSIFLTMDKQSFMYLAVPMIFGLIVVGAWIQIIFLGLFGGSVRNDVSAAKDGSEKLKQAMIAKHDAMGPWILHTKLVLFFILLTSLIIIFRNPIVEMEYHIPKNRQGESLTYIAVIVLVFALPINFLFCRYYCCLPAVKKATTPSLTTWKASNAETPWAHVLMLASTYGFIMGMRESGMFQLIQDTLVGRNLGTYGAHFWGSFVGMAFSSVAPATALAKYTLFDMLKSGGALEAGRGSIAVPYTIALYNQFLLPISASTNTIVSGFGNIRPYQFLIGGSVPTLFMFLALFIFSKTNGEQLFPNYLNTDDDADAVYTTPIL